MIQLKVGGRGASRSKTTRYAESKAFAGGLIGGESAFAGQDCQFRYRRRCSQSLITVSRATWFAPVEKRTLTSTPLDSLWSARSTCHGSVRHGWGGSCDVWRLWHHNRGRVEARSHSYAGLCRLGGAWVCPYPRAGGTLQCFVFRNAGFDTRSFRCLHWKFALLPKQVLWKV